MISDDDRREVARRLRELHLGGGSKDLIERTLSDAIGAWRESGMSWDFITERLADLIEPDEPPYNLYSLYEAVLRRHPRGEFAIEDDEVDELVDALLDICNSPGHERIQTTTACATSARGGGGRQGEGAVHVVNDDERREVAARLRSANEHSCSPDCELRYVLDGSHDCKGNGCTGCHRDAFDRLADLIDPGDMSQGRRDIVACDRDALLALAEGLEFRADKLIRAAQHARFSGLGPTMGRAKHDASEMRGIARRIREALGVVE